RPFGVGKQRTQDRPLLVSDLLPSRHEPTLTARHPESVYQHALTPEGAQAVYGAAVAAGKLQYVPRTSGISTTDLIQRVIDANSTGALDRGPRRGD
ncbi:MAG: hypothetical protein QM638_04615, partial [Nocardioides sp.]|uniref:hypothetical protein n=1 Tax=Nocardioides sp. TaxID=35761 RepID=UPI0039E321B3